MGPKTISEKILSIRSGQDARAGDVVVCEIDCVIGTDASTPMAIEYFEQMGGERVRHADRIVLALDHYAPPASATTAGFHDRLRAFADRYGITVCGVGHGISHQVAAESGRVLPGQLVVGGDSHTVTCGALNAFATGIGSSDLAAAFLTGHVWLKVPASIRVVLTGDMPLGVGPKDIVLALVGQLGSDGAAYQALEYYGPVAAALELEDRFVLSNMSVEMDAKAGVFPADDETYEYLHGRTTQTFTPVSADDGAVYTREVVLEVSNLTPNIALPHDPDNVVPIGDAADTPVQMVFLGTCTGGRVRDFHEARDVLVAGGGVAPGVELVVTPASREVYVELIRDGTIAQFASWGAMITTPGCGACCGSSGPIPGNGINVISTGSRNFKARMGNGTASIYLASPATCAAAAVTGRITDPREIGR